MGVATTPKCPGHRIAHPFLLLFLHLGLGACQGCQRRLGFLQQGGEAQILAVPESLA